MLCYESHRRKMLYFVAECRRLPKKEDRVPFLPGERCSLTASRLYRRRRKRTLSSPPLLEKGSEFVRYASRSRRIIRRPRLLFSTRGASASIFVVSLGQLREKGLCHSPFKSEGSGSAQKVHKSKILGHLIISRPRKPEITRPWRNVQLRKPIQSAGHRDNRVRRSPSPIRGLLAS